MNFQSEVLQNTSHLNNYALHLTSDVQDAKDLTQETLLKAFCYETKYIEDKNMRSWLFTIMKNTFINTYRKNNNRQKMLSEIHHVKTYVNSSIKNELDMDLYVMREDIYNAIIHLDCKYRLPFILFYKGFKYKEIASRLDLPIGTVKSRIYFTRKMLMETLYSLL
jgi:RNA polymerase sigma factor (sigma-70 family)